MFLNMSSLTKSSRRILVVFDLDLTLWPFRLDKHMRSPFSAVDGGKVVDTCGHEATIMDDSIPSLMYLKDKGYLVGIASRIEDICGAYQLINLLGIAPYIDYREIYPGCKKHHFMSLCEKSNLEFKQMLFFDDDSRNIRDVSKLGVNAVHVPNGISLDIVKENVVNL